MKKNKEQTVYPVGDMKETDYRDIPDLKCPVCGDSYIFCEGSEEKTQGYTWHVGGIVFECWHCMQRFVLRFGLKSFAVFPYITLLPEREITK